MTTKLPALERVLNNLFEYNQENRLMCHALIVAVKDICTIIYQTQPECAIEVDALLNRLTDSVADAVHVEIPEDIS